MLFPLPTGTKWIQSVSAKLIYDDDDDEEAIEMSKYRTQTHLKNQSKTFSVLLRNLFQCHTHAQAPSTKRIAIVYALWQQPRKARMEEWDLVFDPL